MMALEAKAQIVERVSFLPVGELRIDPTYQRDLSLPKVRRIASSWSDAKADSITVSARANGFYVLDGQHRLAAARIAHVVGLWALIHVGLSQAEEAELFVALNTERTRPKALALFKSRLTYDPIAREIVEIAESEGWMIQMTDNTIRHPRRTLAVAMLDSLYAAGGPDLVRRTLSVAGSAWPEDLDAGRADVLGSVGEFIRVYKTHPRFDIARLTTKLSEKPVVAIRQRIRALYSLSGSGGTRAGGDQTRAGLDAVLESYNRALRSGWLPALTVPQRLALIRDPAAFVWPV